MIIDGVSTQSCSIRLLMVTYKGDNFRDQIYFLISFFLWGGVGGGGGDASEDSEQNLWFSISVNMHYNACLLVNHTHKT